MLTDAYVGGGGYLKCLRKHFEFVKIIFIPQNATTSASLILATPFHTKNLILFLSADRFS